MKQSQFIILCIILCSTFFVAINFPFYLTRPEPYEKAFDKIADWAIHLNEEMVEAEKIAGNFTKKYLDLQKPVYCYVPYPKHFPSERKAFQKAMGENGWVTPEKGITKDQLTGAIFFNFLILIDKEMVFASKEIYPYDDNNHQVSLSRFAEEVKTIAAKNFRERS